MYVVRMDPHAEKNCGLMGKMYKLNNLKAEHMKHGNSQVVWQKQTGRLREAIE